ncbi:ferredoxin reductase family protein [Nitriliruptor alkaliphilus]|uniref:ferredoxin reductase family protein n=1 Tax=Nitriliruptor alkaliphilus TaxID=427918 RepID=UPI000697CD3E|nr:ferric reductase-like transmembrane domain-containing protein [Nitriliruptor alkaliphilus]
MTLAVRGMLWSVVYLIMVVAPLFFMIVGDPPPARGFWMELSIALGFVGLSMLGLQFATTARFHPVSAPYGLDLVLKYHKQISYVAFGFLLIHPIILVFVTELGGAIFDPSEAEADGITGILALGLVVLIIAASIWRERLGLSYELWRVTHGLLGLAIIIMALVHIWLAGYYVDGPIRRGLWIVMTALFISMYAHVRLIRPWQLRRRPWVVERVQELPGDTWELHLRADGHDGMRFEPGQFAWLTLARSPYAITEHPFSFCSSAERTDTVTFGIKELGDFTSTIGTYEPGTRAYLDGPHGAFTYERNEAPGFVFVVGGIGITPVMSMLHTLADRGDQRPVWLIYGNPSWDEVAYLDELDDLEQRLDLTIVHVLDDPPDGWAGETGFITPEVLDRHLPEDEHRLEHFVCGPDPMMDAVEEALHDRGIPGEKVNLERFDFL